MENKKNISPNIPEADGQKRAHQEAVIGPDLTRDDAKEIPLTKQSRDQIFVNLTGNPFVDAGMWAISGLSGKEKPEDLTREDLEEAKEKILSLYFKDGWKKTLYSVFTTNSRILNPSLDNKKEYRALLEDLLKEIEEMPLQNRGSCIGCGRRDFKKRITNTEIPLTGSGANLNYFSYLVRGADYCPACTFSIQFSPLLMYWTPWNKHTLLFLHSQSEKVMKYGIRKPIRDIEQQILTKNYSGCCNKGIKNPVNALFDIVLDILRYTEERWQDEKPAIQFYHFTNFGQSPSLEVYSLPDDAFRFLALVKRHEMYNEWQKVVKKGYRNVNWDKVKEEKDYVNKMNKVFQNLLNGKSIVTFFFDSKKREVYGNWELLSYYLLEVRNMDKERIETIKEVGDKIANYIKESGDIKRLDRLERTDTYRGFRNQLRIIIRDRVAANYDDILFDFDEYVNHLVPDYKEWRETQDLLLFRIYEQLYDWLLKVDKENEKEKEVNE